MQSSSYLKKNFQYKPKKDKGEGVKDTEFQNTTLNLSTIHLFHACVRLLQTVHFNLCQA